MTRPKEGASFPRLCRPGRFSWGGGKGNTLSHAYQDDPEKKEPKISRRVQEVMRQALSVLKDFKPMTDDEYIESLSLNDLRKELKWFQQAHKNSHLEKESKEFQSTEKQIKEKNRRKKRAIITQAQAAVAYGVEIRTIRNWESNPDSAPAEYVGRNNRADLKTQGLLYQARKEEQRKARVMNRGDYRDYNRQERPPEFKDLLEEQVWKEDQELRETGNKPEK